MEDTEVDSRAREQFFITIVTWAKVRGDYSQEEKDKLNAAIVGETICPRGVFLDAEKLGADLVAKIRVSNKATNALVQR